MPNPSRFKCFGGRAISCQVARIEDGLRELGWAEATDDIPADLVYANDEPRWQQAIDYRAAVCPNAKLILCVLDIPVWNLPRGYDPYACFQRLRQANAAVSISAYVQDQVRDFYGMESSVIGQPIQPVNADKRRAGVRPFPYRAMMIGRLGDPNKRATMAIQGMIMAGFNEAEVAIVGEYPGWGTKMDTVSTEILNDLYNSVDFVLCATLGAGLELPILEGLAAGSIPVVCHDLTTLPEIAAVYGNVLVCYPNAQAIAYGLRKMTDNPQFIADQHNRCLAGPAAVVAQTYSARAVAERLVSVYQSL